MVLEAVSPLALNLGIVIVIPCTTTIMADDLLKQAQEFFEGQIVILPFSVAY